MVARCAATAFGERVNTFMPSMTGVAQAGMRLRRLLHLHQAHAAVGGDGELGVIAEARDVDVRRVRDLHDHRALASLQRHAVDLDIDQIVAHRAPLLRRAGGAAGWPSTIERPLCSIMY